MWALIIEIEREIEAEIEREIEIETETEIRGVTSQATTGLALAVGVRCRGCRCRYILSVDDDCKSNCVKLPNHSSNILTYTVQYI